MSLNPKISKKDKVVIFGHKGLIGSAIFKELKHRNYKNLITIDKKKLNLLNYENLKKFFILKKPNIIIIAAARVGGIQANNIYPFNFLYENTVIQNNIISLSVKFNCKKLIFLGSSCIYPKLWKRPFKEEDLSLSKLEKTNEYYAIAKISGLKLCEAYNNQYNGKLPKFITIIPPNLFGSNDNYNSQNSHVLAALLKKFYLAKKRNLKKISIWGTGRPRREFLYSIDAANIIIDIMELSEKYILKYTKGKFSHINIGSGNDYTINTIASIIKKISGFNGKIQYDKSYPDGVKRKVLNINLLKKLSPKSVDKKGENRKFFEANIEKIYKELNEEKFEKFEKNNTFNLPV
jgi:GDP-L-fucose synthase